MRPRLHGSTNACDSIRHMAHSPIILHGDIVEDERQLDGSRHLTLTLVDDDAAWSCTVNLHIDRENRLREGSLEIDSPARVGSAVLDRVLDLQVEPALALSAEFSDIETDSVRWRLRLADAPVAAGRDDAIEATLSLS